MKALCIYSIPGSENAKEKGKSYVKVLYCSALIHLTNHSHMSCSHLIECYIRHKISGTWKKQDLAAEHRQRTAVSKAFAELGSPGQDPRLRPSSITHLLSTAAEVTVDTLMDLSYVESEVSL